MVSNPIMGCMGIGSPSWWDWVMEENKVKILHVEHRMDVMTYRGLL
jgi:hypothetical protein